MGFGLGKAFKKFTAKAINTVTGGNDSLNKIAGVALAPVSGGASLSVANQANRMEAARDERKMAQEQAAAEAQAADNANKEFIASVNRQRETSLLGKTKTDYTGDLEKPVYTGDLSKTDEDSDETVVKLMSRPLLAKRRKLLGM